VNGKQSYVVKNGSVNLSRVVLTTKEKVNQKMRPARETISTRKNIKKQKNHGKQGERKKK